MLEGDYLDQVPEGEGGAAVEAAPSRRRGALVIVAMTAAALAAAVGVLAIAGAFSEDSGGSSTGLAAYKADVRGYCKLALAGEDRDPAGSTAARARGYLEVIETMRGRLESLPPPSGSDPSLERFREGLTQAADFTSDVAQSPPALGTRAEATVVAELTFAAGQVQAGAVGYGLGASCVAIGDLVARSAQNAAGAP